MLTTDKNQLRSQARILNLSLIICDTNSTLPATVLATSSCIGVGASIPPKAMTQPSPFPFFPLSPLLPSLPSPFLPFLPFPFPSLPFPSLPLEVGHPQIQLGGLEERCKLPQRRNRIWCILALKYDLWGNNFKLCPPNFLIFVHPRISVTHILCRRGCLWTPLHWSPKPTATVDEKR